MNLEAIAHRTIPPAPWQEGDNIPWHDPDFSDRMLAEHLSQEHDAASRRIETIDRHVAFIHRQLLQEKPARILDLGCGPGLYVSRLAQSGHYCMGIDYSPASIAYARQSAESQGVNCVFRLEDIRRADFGSGYDLVMLIFGEFNVFRPADAALILVKARRALKPGGQLLLEPHTFAAVEAIGHAPAGWRAQGKGLFSASPHLLLEENFWDAEAHTATTRFFVVDAASGQVERYAQTFQAYSENNYRDVLHAHGFTGVTFFPALVGETGQGAQGLLAITARTGFGE